MALASKIELRAADGQVHRPTIDPNVATVDSVEFKGPFAERSEATVSLPADLKDDAGRTLANAAAFPMKVRIDDDPPLVKFPSRFGILEVNAQPALPVTVRNVEPMLDAYALDVAKAPNDQAGARAASSASTPMTTRRSRSGCAAYCVSPRKTFAAGTANT